MIIAKSKFHKAVIASKSMCCEDFFRFFKKVIKSFPENLLHAFFYKPQFYKQRQVEIGKKLKQELSNTLRVNFRYLKIIYILHLCYPPNTLEDILKNVQDTSTLMTII